MRVVETGTEWCNTFVRSQISVLHAAVASGWYFEGPVSLAAPWAARWHTLVPGTYTPMQRPGAKSHPKTKLAGADGTAGAGLRGQNVFPNAQSWIYRKSQRQQTGFRVF